MNIVVCTMVYQYQKRYWWQLSSLKDQRSWEGHPVPRILAHADISARDMNYGWNDQLLRTFSEIVSSEEPAFDHIQRKWRAEGPAAEDPFGRRGHIRSANIRDVLNIGWADWLLFNDADMVYDPQFFSHLMTIVDPEESRVYATDRWTMPFEDGYRLVDSVKYDGPIEDPTGRIKQGVDKLRKSAGGRISGAGFFQLVSVKALRKLVEQDPGYADYVPPGWNRDHNTFEQNHITRSDKKFRSRLGGIVPIHALPQYHLNHWRKTDEQYDPELLH